MSEPAEPPVTLAPPGAGNLEVTGPLGRGAMGEVLRAQDPRLHREVAVKRLDGRHAQDPSATRRFVAEAQLTAQLDHPGIVPVHQLDLGEGGPSYAMKLVRGRTLRAVLDEARQGGAAATSLPARLELFLGICEPVHYAHARGVIHRDLKPDNIMVGAFGEVFVMDWGVARLAGARADAAGGRPGDDDDSTQAGDAVGTPSYMSPEQARGENDALDARSDQYALGLLLYEIVTLRRARGSIKPGVPMLVAASRGHVEPIVGTTGPVSRELRAVIRKATAAEPDRRYASVAQLADDVRHVIRGEAVRAAPDTLTQRLGRWVGRNRERVAMAGLTTALVVVAAFVALVALALGLREVDRRQADVRAARLVEVTSTVSDRSRSIDLALLRYEGLLRGLVGAAERALQHDAPGPVYLAGAFSSAGPPDLVASQVYGGPTSFAFPDLVAAEGADTSAPAARALASLRPELQAALVASAPASADARSLVLQAGTPIVWSYVATESGLMVGYPGTGVYPPAYDPRTRPWYAQGRDATGPTWGKPYLDESGMGLLVSCAAPVRAPDGALAGVAGVDLTVRYIVATWLQPGDLPAEGVLVEGDGNIVVRTGPRTAPVGEVERLDAWALVDDRASGHVVSGDRVVAWSRLEAMPWTYIVTGKSSEILGE